MTNKNTIELIVKDLRDFEKLVVNFKNYSSIPSIELDLALSKLRNLYEALIMLKDTKVKDSQEDLLFIDEQPEMTEMKEEAVIEVKEAQEKEQKKPIAAKELTLAKEEKTEKPEKQKVELSEISVYQEPEIPEAMVEPESDIPEPVIKTQEKRAYVAGTLVGERYRDNQSFINKKLGEQAKIKDLTSKIQSTPIKTIAGSIGINDKFFFIRELFKGNTEEFQLTVGMLDNSHNFNSAYNYLIEHFDWDMESEPVQQLLNLIRRKFISQGNE